jgi:hypothetical protein
MTTMARPASVLFVLAILAGGVVYLVVHDKAPSSCGVVLSAQWSGRQIGLSNCADQLVPPPAGITVASGGIVTLDHDQWSGFFSSNPAVLSARPPGRHVAVFQALVPGAATIRVRTDDSCASRSSKSTCNVVTVRVLDPDRRSVRRG